MMFAMIPVALVCLIAQFIPGKRVVIHPAVVSDAVRAGSLKGPGAGLGATLPKPVAAGSARAPRPAPPIVPPPAAPDVGAAAKAVEQTVQGKRTAIVVGASFDGLAGGIDISLAVGPEHVFQILNREMAVFDKRGKRLYGPVPNNTIFAGFGDRCSATNEGDSVVRYDQLADRWLVVMPVFLAPYAMCYAVSATNDPLGMYYRYEFKRPLFPDYPRPAVWPDGYYNPSSTSDNLLPEVITQKHECIAERNKMLHGEDAAEQCVIIDGGVFTLNSDVDGKRPPPEGAPNIMMSTGGTQLMKVFEDDGVYFYKVHVDWKDPAKTTVSAPQKIPVAPYHYLCDGQLSNCVSQPGTERRLDSQGDKLIQRLVYRNFGDHESILAEHSIATVAKGGGVRWYEFRLDKQRDPLLYQQGTYAPGGQYRWVGSMAMDRKGAIGMGYSFGGDPNYAGVRFAARLQKDAKGQFTFHESVLAEGEASQTGRSRWEDYTNIAMDPADHCTFWFTGNYVKKGEVLPTTRIGSFVVPGCRILLKR